MTLLVILALASAAVLTYAVVHVLRHDPRPRDLQPPRSHEDELAAGPWYAATPRDQAGRWAA